MPAGPLTLVIETSNPGSGSPGEVGLARDGALVATRALDPKGRHDDALVPAIDALVAGAGAKPNDIGRVAVSAGPGGFSSVRIAVATAKMIALATGAACVPVPSCRSAAAGRGGKVAVALAGKRESAWVRIYEDMRASGDGVVVDAPGLAGLHAQRGFTTLVADDHLPAPMREWATGAGVTVSPPVFSAQGCLDASAGLAPVSAAGLAVVYPREPEAVRKWRAAKAPSNS